MSSSNAFEQPATRATRRVLRVTNSGKQTLSGLRYRPIIALGQGGMADVQLAVGRGPSGFNKLVVLKVMRKELGADEDMRQLFLAEARLSARLNNANVVQVYEVIDTALPCIVMEYLDGQPLSLLQQEAGDRFTLPLQLRVMSEALAGLHYSHELNDYDGTPLNIVHRDMSPQNIFVTYDGVVKVLDFGIAKASNALGQTRTGIIKGKLSYMPRQQLLNEELDRRADVYAVGCILWHVAAGCKLWFDMPEGEVMRALIDGTIPRPSEKRPVDPKLEHIVMKALEPDPGARYPSAMALRNAIDEYLAEISPTTTMREVGELVSSVFAEQQLSRKQHIQQALQTPLTEPPQDVPEGLESIIQDTADPSLGVSDHSRKGKVSWVRLAVTFAALAVVGGAVAVLTHERGHSAGAPRVINASANIQIRLASTPDAAVLYVDGNRLPKNPSVLTVAPDDKDHVILAMLEGHEAYKKTVRFERDLSLDIILQREAPTSASASTPQPPVAIPSVTSRTKAHVPASRDAKAKNDCDPLFYFEKGIKTYKPGCL